MGVTMGESRSTALSEVSLKTVRIFTIMNIMPVYRCVFRKEGRVLKSFHRRSESVLSSVTSSTECLVVAVR